MHASCTGHKNASVWRLRKRTPINQRPQVSGCFSSLLSGATVCYLHGHPLVWRVLKLWHCIGWLSWVHIPSGRAPPEWAKCLSPTPEGRTLNTWGSVPVCLTYIRTTHTKETMEWLSETAGTGQLLPVYQVFRQSLYKLKQTNRQTKKTNHNAHISHSHQEQLMIWLHCWLQTQKKTLHCQQKM